MKFQCLFVAVLFVNALHVAEGVHLASRRVASQDRTITKVVKLLQGMLDASRADADTEADSYAKFKCYSDTQTREKTESIRTLTKQIRKLTSKIEELQSDNAQLSVEVAQLKKDMAANVLARTQADKIRGDEKKAYDALKADMDNAILLLGQAIDALAEVGADQNLADGEYGADHEQYMAGYTGASLLKVRTQVKQALVAARTFLTQGQQTKFRSFLQEPFTGAYMTQSGEVVGILKDMEATFTANLKAATEAEKKAIKAHKEYIETKKEEWDTMDSSYTDKQSDLSSNDAELTTKKVLHATAVQQKADDEEFLEKLKPIAEQKAKEWEARKMWRANEDAAISEAIAILDSDKSFKSFGKVEATKTGATGFLQLSAERHQSSRSAAWRSAKEFLQQAARSVHSKRLAKIASLLGKGNPFTAVIEAIEGVKSTIKDEAKVDKDHFDWCADERKKNNDALTDKKKQITNLNADISKLDDSINNPQTGLIVMIEQTETDLETNLESQTDETKTRKEENVEYQREAQECEDADEILKQAVAILDQYYSDMAASYAKEMKEITGFAQEDPAPPTTWGTDYKGQGDQGDKVIKMLEFVIAETEKEATALHDDELSAQHAYEDSMQSLKDAEETLQGQLVRQKKDLADAQEELATKEEDLAQTEKEKTAIEKYLEEIKPGCDFITDNFQTRETNRGKEVAALNTAIGKLKGTAGFAKATLADTHEDWELQGCKEVCIKSSANHASCKACLAEVSVPGYCAGHPATLGC